jgi:hypothetical protein
LRRLRIANIRQGRDQSGRCMEIEIAPKAQFGRLKTPAAQRRLTIRNRDTIALAIRWMRKRKMDGAPRSAFLFGDPTNDASVYRGAAVVSLLNRLLKVATGEHRARIHWLRHGAVAKEMMMNLDAPGMLDLNRHVLIATAAGHATPMTTFTSYFHSYESGLRAQLNRALVELIPMSGEKGQSILKIKADTLRQRAHRHSIKLDAYIWQEIQASPISVAFTNVDHPFGWHTPSAPKLLPSARQTITVATVLDLLGHLSTGISVQTLAVRYAISTRRLEKMVYYFTDFCFNLAIRAWPRQFNDRSDRPLDLQLALCMARLDLKRARQSKYSKLSEWLAQEQAQSVTVMRSALESWLTCRRGTYIEIDKPGPAIGLYALLAMVKIDPQDLRICRQKGSTTTSRSQFSDANVVAEFSALLGLPPRVAIQQQRQGRPNVYLLWDAPSHRAKPVSAASSLCGLNAWMAAIAAFLFLFEDESWN